MNRDSRAKRKATAQQIFRENLDTLLREKGLEKASHVALSKQMSAFLAGEAMITPDRMEYWRNHGLPRYRQFMQLADWLDCEPIDLLPEIYHEVLEGYWQAA